MALLIFDCLNPEPRYLSSYRFDTYVTPVHKSTHGRLPGARGATFPLEKKSQWSMVVSEGATSGNRRLPASTPSPCQALTGHAKGPSKGSRIHPAGRHATDGHEPRQVRKEAAISDAGCVVLRYRLPVFRGPFLGPLA